MYNYYQYEKNRQEKINKIKQARKALNLSIHHKELNKKLVSNYNNKIKKFIVDLVKKPIIIQDYSSPVVTTRKQLINEENKKPEQPKKDFVFRGFLTEKERIVF